MSFNIGLSALFAAQQDINITGNNIANAGTTGFKQSKANFGDVYTATVFGGGAGQQGSGVMLQEIRQSFSQGNINFTNNTLDMAINGEGFFVLRGESGTSYSRAGAFGTNTEGQIVNSMGERVQGYQATATGEPTGGGQLTDLVVTTGEIPPRPTTQVESRLNLDASALPTSVVGTTLAANGGASGEPQPIEIGPDQDRVNGFDSNAINVVGSDGVERLISIPENGSANRVSQLFSGVPGVNAQATTVGFLSDFVLDDGELGFNVNGRAVSITDLTEPADQDEINAAVIAAINAQTSNVTAQLVENDAGNEIVKVTHSVGADLIFTPIAGGPASNFDIYGSTRDADGNPRPTNDSTPSDFGANQAVVLGGTIDLTLDENVTMSAAEEDANGDEIIQADQIDSIFGDISAPDALDGIPFETNEFDPTDPNTYYRSTSVPIYDSLGNQHSLNMFFVRERPEPGEANNTWSVYLQVDGQDIGYDPNSATGEPVLARHQIRFDDSGMFDANQPPIEITNWTPVDELGRPIGAGPVQGNPNVAEQTTNSNFTLDLAGLTQFGGDFSVLGNNQDGYAKGQLTGLDINDRGLISARFSNGQSRAVGEVALANFAVPEKLNNLGGTRFAETSESGEPNISGAGTAGLGLIQSGALEDSNVDLPEELVNLIVAQRNYQAAAQVISAADTTTQTVINL